MILPSTPEGMLYHRLDEMSLHVIKETVRQYDELPEAYRDANQAVLLDRIAAIKIEDLRKYIYHKENCLIINGMM